MCDVNKLWEQREKRAPTWEVAVKIPPRVRPRPRLWHLPDFITFIWKNVFSKELGCFYRFQKFFFMETYGLNIWIQLSNSNLFLWPLKVGGNLKGTINFIGDSANTKEIYIYLVDSTSWKIFSEARCSGVSYFPMQATIIILLSIENQVNWILKSHMSTCQSHSSLTHTSNPQNQKLMTIIFFKI